MTTTLANLTDSELTDRAAELRKALATTEAEIEVREKVADWPTAPLIVASVDGGGPQLLSVITTHAAATMTSAIVRRSEHTLTNVVPVTVVPAAEYETLEAAHQAWKDSDYTSEQWRDAVTYAGKRLISAAEEVQG